MLRRTIAITIYLIAWVLATVSVSSANVVEARKLMEFGNVGWEDEMARLDYLDSKLREEPDSIAHIIVYGRRSGAKRGDTEARMMCIKDYLVNRRGVQTERIVITNGGFREESTVEVWLTARGESGPTATPTGRAKEVKFKKGKVRNWRGHCKL